MRGGKGGRGQDENEKNEKNKKNKNIRIEVKKDYKKKDKNKK